MNLQRQYIRRGDSETKYSEAVGSIHRIYGTRYFTAILAALGKDTLERSTWNSGSKRSNLSYLLGVCIPDVSDTADTLRSYLNKTNISEKRLIEAALYSPEWIDIVGEYLDWEGFVQPCWYFMAYMNEEADDKRTTMIAKFTPLSVEELKSSAACENRCLPENTPLGRRCGKRTAKGVLQGQHHHRDLRHGGLVHACGYRIPHH